MLASRHAAFRSTTRFPDVLSALTTSADFSSARLRTGSDQVVRTAACTVLLLPPERGRATAVRDDHSNSVTEPRDRREAKSTLVTQSCGVVQDRAESSCSGVPARDKVWATAQGDGAAARHEVWHRVTANVAFRIVVASTASRVRDPPGGSRQSGFCKLQATTPYGGLSRLSVGNTVRRGELVVDFARVAAFRAPVLWTLRLTHRCDSRPVYARRKAPSGHAFGSVVGPP
jgi:hypothetical protein